MTKEEIKERYSMTDILAQYGIKPNRANFISCPFHNGDNAPSMKIYPSSYHCFACNANGDIFSFVQQMTGLSFVEAFRSLGGTYEYEAYKTKEEAMYSGWRTRQAVNAKKLKKQMEEKRRVESREKQIEAERQSFEVVEIYANFLARIDETDPQWPEALTAYMGAIINYSDVADKDLKAMLDMYFYAKFIDEIREKRGENGGYVEL